MTFREKLEKKWSEGKFVCVGLDTDAEEARKRLGFSGSVHDDLSFCVSRYNEQIVEATKDLVCAYKPNWAFYLKYGVLGLIALRNTVIHIKSVAPDVPIILDAKVADIGSTNDAYVHMAFEHMHFDAITVHPYLGGEALKPFLDQKDKGIFVLCRTSNPGAGEFQDYLVPEPDMRMHIPLYQRIANRVAFYWNKNRNCGLVVGATHPRELEAVRERVGDTVPFLIPGIGVQGGDLEAAVKAARDSTDDGFIINSSRGIIFASQGSDFAEAARRETQKLHDQINLYRK